MAAGKTLYIGLVIIAILVIASFIGYVVYKSGNDTPPVTEGNQSNNTEANMTGAAPAGSPPTQQGVGRKIFFTALITAAIMVIAGLVVYNVWIKKSKEEQLELTFKEAEQAHKKSLMKEYGIPSRIDKKGNILIKEGAIIYLNRRPYRLSDGTQVWIKELILKGTKYDGLYDGLHIHVLNMSSSVEDIENAGYIHLLHTDYYEWVDRQSKSRSMPISTPKGGVMRLLSFLSSTDSGEITDSAKSEILRKMISEADKIGGSVDEDQIQIEERAKDLYKVNKQIRDAEKRKKKIKQGG